MTPESIKAVLTGDIVDSTQFELSQLETCQELIVTAAEEAAEAFGPLTFPAAGFFRGDSWQLTLDSPRFALHAAVFFRCALLKHQKSPRFDTRLSVGIGPTEASSTLKSGHGTAFLLSGRGLERLDAASKFSPHLALSSHTFDHSLLNALAVLTDYILVQTTPHQARAIYETLLGKTQEQIALEWSPPIDQPAVLRHLKRGGWEALQHALESFESVFTGEPPSQSSDEIEQSSEHVQK